MTNDWQALTRLEEFWTNSVFEEIRIWDNSSMEEWEINKDKKD